MQDLTRELSQRYQDRIVIFDSPPLLATSQASVLATHVGQILVVVEANKTSQLVLKEALSLFDPDKVIGLILNKSRRFSAARGYGYYGYYSHGAQES
jgi:Mrp family chromosome partitioning ATPase